MADADPVLSLGRGRGRGTPRTAEDKEGSSSASEKRPHDKALGNGNGNGNGQKRGTTRDQRTINTFYKTKPSSAENSKEGTSGVTVSLSANYFRLNTKPNFEFRMYRVDFEPEIELVALRKAFIGRQRDVLGGNLYDGASSVYLTRRLPDAVTQFDCESREGVSYKMIIKDTGTTIQMTDNQATQILNLILRRMMGGLEMQLVGRNMYDQKAKVNLQNFKVELWPGYVTSIRQHEHNVLVCCEVSHKVMRQETIRDIMLQCRADGGANWKLDFEKEIIGATVLTGYNNHTYLISDVNYEASPSSTFDQKGTQVSYAAYYASRYQLNIKDLKQPMLVSMPKARDIRSGRDMAIYLVPELCRATGMTDKMRANFQMMKAMAEHTQMNPTNRKDRLLQFTSRLAKSEISSNHLDSFNTSVANELVSFTGRALKQETILFGNGATSMNDNRVDWTNGCKKEQMFQTVDLKRWAVIYPRRSKEDVEIFLNLMRQVAGGMRYEMGNPKMYELSDDRTPSYTAEIKNVLSKDPKLIMVVVPNNAADKYALIKRLTCVEKAVPTQVIVSRTMQPKKGNMAGVMSIATKVMIQINCKLGGAPWMIKFPMSGVMTIGFDVTHDTRDKSQSYGAFVASMDLKQIVEYYSGVTPHKSGEEMSTNIESHLVLALKTYKNRHGALPDRIFFYRDGVSDGQIEYVHSQEVTRLNNKLLDLYTRFGAGAVPKFAFIIVNKRINTRIFLNLGRKVENPNPGTVVDNTITLPERYDFYLVSQSVRQGTVSPTSYNIIYDTCGLKPDLMQQFTYKQTHLYYNWSGTLRVPAVVQYAHKLAFLVGQYLHQSPNEDLRTKLYYL